MLDLDYLVDNSISMSLILADIEIHSISVFTQSNKLPTNFVHIPGRGH